MESKIFRREEGEREESNCINGEGVKGREGGGWMGYDGVGWGGVVCVCGAVNFMVCCQGGMESERQG